MSSSRLRQWFFDLQLILDAEDAGYAVGGHEGELLVAGVGNNALERDVTVLHDDVNRSDRSHGVPEERRIVHIDRAIDCGASLIIHVREWKHFNPVVD